MELDIKNRKHILKQLAAEQRKLEKFLKRGILGHSNGLEVFARVCDDRLSLSPRLLEHGKRVRTIAYRLAEASEQKKGKRREMDSELFEVVARIGSRLDVGMMMVLPELAQHSAEMGQEEVWMLRRSHVEAGVGLLNLYMGFMKEREYRIARYMMEGHHVAYDGIGTKNAPSYPEQVNGLVVLDNIRKTRTGIVSSNIMPDIIHIVRLADVFSAIALRNPDVSKGKQAFGKLTGIDKVDAALAVLVAVAGIDVDPKMVKFLMVYGYDVSQMQSDIIIGNLCYRGQDMLREETDISYAEGVVSRNEDFRDILKQRKGILSELLDTAVIEFGKRK